MGRAVGKEKSMDKAVGRERSMERGTGVEANTGRDVEEDAEEGVAVEKVEMTEVLTVTAEPAQGCSLKCHLMNERLIRKIKTHYSNLCVSDWQLICT